MFHFHHPHPPQPLQKPRQSPACRLFAVGGGGGRPPAVHSRRRLSRFHAAAGLFFLILAALQLAYLFALELMKRWFFRHFAAE
jgi:hypothetical protein